MTNESCDICAEKMNKTNHRPIVCPQHRCGKTVCSTCIEQYLLTLMTSGGQCMHCRVEYDPMWLRRQMTKVFINGEYRRHQEHLLVEHEKSLFPVTMPVIESTRQQRKIDQEIADARRKIADLRKFIEIKLMDSTRLRHSIQRDLRRINNPDPLHEQELSQDETDTTIHYLRPCVQEDCPGHVHSRTGVCATCEGSTCLRCNIALPFGQNEDHEEHICKEEDLEHWNLIRSSTKPCPGCRTRITKISGCDQMWCPQCHTAFRWSTGQIERGPIHNPEYYRWMFGGQQAAPMANVNGGGADAQEGGEANCGNPNVLPEARLINRVIRTKLKSKTIDDVRSSEPVEKEISMIHQKLSHLKHMEIPTFNLNVGSEEGFMAKKTTLRIQYLSKIIPFSHFQTSLYRLEKAHRKTMEHNRILTTFCTLSVEAFRGFCYDPTFTIKNLIDRINYIQQISNEAIKDLNQCYKSDISILKYISFETSNESETMYWRKICFS